MDHGILYPHLLSMPTNIMETLGIRYTVLFLPFSCVIMESSCVRVVSA